MTDTEFEHGSLKNMFYVPMEILRVIGIKPKQHKKIAYVVCGLVQCLRLMVFALIGGLIYEKRSLESIVEGLNTLAEFCQGFPVFLYIYYEVDITILYEDLDKYWTEEETKKISIIFKKISILGLIFCYVTFVILFGIPLVTQKFVFIVHVPNVSHGFNMVLALQALCLFYDVAVFYTNLCFLVGMSIVFTCQFRILNGKFRTIGMKNGVNPNLSEDVVKDYIEYHKMLLLNSDRLNYVYSVPLLVQYFVSAISVMCVMMRINDYPDITTIVCELLYLTCVLFQLSLFCFTSEALTNETEDTLNAIYESLWYENHHFAKTYVQQITIRAQKPIVVKAAGIAEINRATFVQILKLTFSLFTFVNNLMENNPKK